MSELLAVLSNPKRRRRGRRRNPWATPPMRGARRRRRAGLMKSVHRSGGARVTRSAWRRSGYRRNPRALFGGGRGAMLGRGLGQELIAALAGAAGGAAVDLMMRPMPLAMKAGPLNYLVRGAASIGLGLIGQLVKVPGAAELARGAMTITVYNALRQYVLVPRGLGELSEEDVAAIAAMNPEEVVVDGVGEYLLPAPAVGEYTMGEVLEPELSAGPYVED